ncbi:unnamed protein product [Arabis nemorensis]|uniref:U1-type domain-containing protein n=1 Tax=Arabis nemorensis TaxID=586526 RepID=A0A565BSU9_9BRAS|nr:unnamed protein product [Arabis nemorensis]
MDYYSQSPAPAEMNQPAYYAPCLNQNLNSTSDLQTHESSSAIAVPPPSGVDVTVNTTPYYTNAQSLAWRDAVRLYGTDPLAITDAAANVTGQPHGIYPDFSWTGHIVQAQLPGVVSSKKQSKKGKAVQSAYCQVCKVDCNGPSVFEQHNLGKKHLKNLDKLKTCFPSNTGSSLPGPPVAVPLTGPQEKPCKSKGRKNGKKGAESTEDLESKRWRVVEGGVSNESITLCRICNVVCNSGKVYIGHLAGQKHAAKAEKASVNA